jgi:hypothetical protein
LTRTLLGLSGELGTLGDRIAAVVKDGRLVAGPV